MGSHRKESVGFHALFWCADDLHEDQIKEMIESGRGLSPPSDEDLKEIARDYLRHLIRRRDELNGFVLLGWGQRNDKAS